MRYETFQGRRVQVIDIDDACGEHVIEFVDLTVDPNGAALAVFASKAGWSNAQVSISPKIGSLSAEFIEWALKIARQQI